MRSFCKIFSTDFFSSGFLLGKNSFSGVNLHPVKNRIKYVKRVQLLKRAAEPELLAIRASGIAEVFMPSTPVLIPRNYKEIPVDGIFEVDFRMEESGEKVTNMEIEVEVLFRFINLPSWVKGVRINASDNSDIELI